MPHSLSRLFLSFYLLITTVTLVVSAQQQVVLGSTNPDIVYLPSLCNVSNTGCFSAWQQIYVDCPSINGTPVIVTSTTGPIPQTGNTVPQLFLTFRASTLYLRTSPLSNATVNFSLTADPSGVTITKQVNTNISLIIADNLPESQTTTLGVTFLQSLSPTRFDVESITLNVTNSSATSSYLPAPTLPISSFPPSLSPSSTNTVISNTSQRTGIIIGATLGGVLGSLVISIAGFFVYRRWRRRQIWRSEVDVGTYPMRRRTATR
ncbi:hypothetical protein DFJ58DRAFT_330350 [Suillus subalutaceus]|uniref:uncharacterized protein n=1 Tax=Suillus subalutaceus TaxID=48586 RepID=UPI001B860675|nr:uncharacterized protein DFJ58DRAFT_330350 [Suillus subalutaceus]KAG1857378.1 hypothetical protein DFJ58DRAFT_330350 [Suillus subalutaceus]